MLRAASPIAISQSRLRSRRVNQRADVRILVEKSYRSKFTSRRLAGLLRRAAEGQQDERGLPLVSPLVAVLVSSNRGKGRRR